MVAVQRTRKGLCPRQCSTCQPESHTDAELLGQGTLNMVPTRDIGSRVSVTVVESTLPDTMRAAL